MRKMIKKLMGYYTKIFTKIFRSIKKIFRSVLCKNKEEGIIIDTHKISAGQVPADILAVAAAAREATRTSFDEL